MAGGDVRGVAAGERRRQPARPFERLNVSSTGGLLKPPMGVQAVLALPVRRIDPAAAGAQGSELGLNGIYELRKS
jgi:hypothetical protein